MRTVPTSLPPRFQALRCRTTRLAERGRRARARGPCRLWPAEVAQRGAESDSIFCWHGRSQQACFETAHPYAFAKKSPTGESPSRHPPTRTDENEPAGLLPRFGPNEDGREERDTTPNPAQKPRRGRRVSVPSPSRSLSRCEHARINPHPPSPAIRPRGGAEAAHAFAHSRGKRRGAFAQPVRVAHPARAGVRRAGSTASERLASRLVVDIRPRRSSPTVRREYPPSHHPPSPRIPFPPRRDTRPR